MSGSKQQDCGNELNIATGRPDTRGRALQLRVFDSAPVGVWVAVSVSSRACTKAGMAEIRVTVPRVGCGGQGGNQAHIWQLRTSCLFLCQWVPFPGTLRPKVFIVIRLLSKWEQDSLLPLPSGCNAGSTIPIRSITSQQAILLETHSLVFLYPSLPSHLSSTKPTSSCFLFVD